MAVTQPLGTLGSVVGGSVVVGATVIGGSVATVVGATVNAGGRLLVRATKVGSDTELAAIGRLVQQAQTGFEGLRFIRR